MGEDNKKSTKSNTYKIILKKGCWLQIDTGSHQLLNDIQAKAEPIFFSNNELRGYNFKNHLYQGITYDLEHITVIDDEEKF